MRHLGKAYSSNSKSFSSSSSLIYNLAIQFLRLDPDFIAMRPLQTPQTAQLNQADWNRAESNAVYLQTIMKWLGIRPRQSRLDVVRQFPAKWLEGESSFAGTTHLPEASGPLTHLLGR
jgi:hypothetical protein